MNPTTTIFCSLVRGGKPLPDPLPPPLARQRLSLWKKFKRLLLVVLALSPLVGSYCLLDEAVQYGWEVGKRASATECGKGGKARPQFLKTVFL